MWAKRGGGGEGGRGREREGETLLGNNVHDGRD